MKNYDRFRGSTGSRNSGIYLRRGSSVGFSSVSAKLRQTLRQRKNKVSGFMIDDLISAPSLKPAVLVFLCGVCLEVFGRDHPPFSFKWVLLDGGLMSASGNNQERCNRKDFINSRMINFNDGGN